MRPIHPFPARMAPEIARNLLSTLQPGSRVFDPMCGSGTVLRQAVEAGHDCVGRDLDPLAVLMTRAWVTPIHQYRLLHDAHDVVARARRLRKSQVVRPWNDDATDAFAKFWFGPNQLDALTRLSTILRRSRYRTREHLMVCLSRTVITKDRGASRARDVSHSRPHRVWMDNDFDVFEGFIRAARLVSDRLAPSEIRGSALVELGDARLSHPEHRAPFDAAMTSPPYLNAIDYMRGHRLSLIWFGYSLQRLQTIRSNSVGCEKALGLVSLDVTPFIVPALGSFLPERYVGWVRRYASDMLVLLGSLQAAVRVGGTLVIVVGNSMIRGCAIDNAGIVIECARRNGLEVVSRKERAITAARRYLPPPSHGSSLAHRMRSENVLVFTVPKAKASSRTRGRVRTSLA